jgi:hypothetical protein
MESTETLWTVFCRLLTESSWSPHRVHETRFEDSMRTVAICVDSIHMSQASHDLSRPLPISCNDFRSFAMISNDLQ